LVQVLIFHAAGPFRWMDMELCKLCIAGGRVR
jgi:hypothetical protein